MREGRGARGGRCGVGGGVVKVRGGAGVAGASRCAELNSYSMTVITG